MEHEQTLAIIKKILAWKDSSDPHGLNIKFHYSSHPSQGEFVRVGPMGYGLTIKYVGYCVQVRKQAGAHGSTQVILRHPDGSLVCHENQGFFSLSPEQEAMARTIFISTPEDEDYATDYKCPKSIHKVGFVIEPAL